MVHARPERGPNIFAPPDDFLCLSLLCGRLFCSTFAFYARDEQPLLFFSRTRHPPRRAAGGLSALNTRWQLASCSSATTKRVNCRFHESVPWKNSGGYNTILYAPANTEATPSKTRLSIADWFTHVSRTAPATLVSFPRPSNLDTDPSPHRKSPSKPPCRRISSSHKQRILDAKWRTDQDHHVFSEQSVLPPCQPEFSRRPCWTGSFINKFLRQ